MFGVKTEEVIKIVVKEKKEKAIKSEEEKVK